jgi:hypothetical protein
MHHGRMPHDRTGAVLAGALLAAMIAAAAPPSAGAQTATSTLGDVGSAASRNGYPAAGGAITLPASPTSGNATTATGATAASGAGSGTTNSGSAASGSSGGGSSGAGAAARTGAASAGSGVRPSGSGGGANWVLCPPAGSSGLLPLFTGTDLSCTPN